MKVATLLSLLLVSGSVFACSEFWLSDQYGLSGRTMDLGGDVKWTMVTVPRGSSFQAAAPGLKLGMKWKAKYGVLGVSLGIVPGDKRALYEGMNEAGMSGSLNALENSSYPAVTNHSNAVGVLDMLAYFLTNHATVSEAVDAMQSGAVQIWPGDTGALTKDVHMALRDAGGNSVVVEWVQNTQKLYVNDKARIMTNEPTLDFHLQNVEYIDWKHSLTRTAVEVPGAFYPAERFARIHLIKQSLVPPVNYQDAVAQVVHVLNSVNVPNGMWGTDTGSSTEGKKTTDHTWWSVIRDHRNKTVYFRTVNNQLIQRFPLSELNLAEGAKVLTMGLDNVPGAFYVDGTKNLQ
eukprot:Hpha_TRINITY_DN15425_c3_g8::TRINITY_DN15425_c3_g8_i1::g.177143::m.177143/K01442/E3.5.1.24; choloylglycine hydrolase